LSRFFSGDDTELTSLVSVSVSVSVSLRTDLAEEVENDSDLSLILLCCDNDDDDDSDDGFSLSVLWDGVLFLSDVGTGEGKEGFKGLIFPPRKSSSAEREGL